MTLAQAVRQAGPDPIAVRCTELLANFQHTADPSDFDELARVAGPFLQRRARFELSRCGSTIDDAEVVQEALLNLYRYAHTFRPRVPHAFSSWAARVVRNVVLRCLRRRRTVATVSLEELEGVDLPDATSHEPIRRLVDDEDRIELRRSLSVYLQFYFMAYLGLTELQRVVLHQVEISGRNYRQIASELGMRVEAVKMVVYRARKRLNANMQRAAAG
ncbi:MAG: RNA polymerase sigma factor [Planctomycetota bacterium]|nr:RNA polymerase sigma factor [Planctomycetota bacterium]